MPIQSYAALSHALSQALGHDKPALKNLFYKKLCFGYASTWLEAYLSSELHLFYARLNGRLTETPQAERAFYQRMAKHQLPPFSEQRLQDFMKTTEYSQEIGSVIRFSGFYAAGEIIELLKILQSFQQLLGCRAGWLLRSKNHCTALCFEGEKIYLCDVNHPHEPIIFDTATVGGLERLVHQLMILMGEPQPKDFPNILSDHRIITFESFAQTRNVSLWTNAVNHLRSNEKFIALQQVTQPKLSHTDPSGQKWAIRAILMQDHALLHALLNLDPALTEIFLSDHQCLSDAMLTGDLETCRMLVERGANLAARDAQGRTALHKAILYGEPEIIQFILNQDKRLSGLPYKGMKAYEYAQRLYSEGDWQTSRKNQIIRALETSEQASTEKTLLCAYGQKNGSATACQESGSPRHAFG